ncbi:hypothetical protein [Pseudobutyrivibrio ruminis]
MQSLFCCRFLWNQMLKKQLFILQMHQISCC